MAILRTNLPFGFIQSKFSADCSQNVACTSSKETYAPSLSDLRKGIHPFAIKEHSHRDGRNKARFGKMINKTTSKIEQKINGNADV